MRTFIYTPVVVSLLFCLTLSAQSDVNLLGKWDYVPRVRTYEKINKVIATTNGFIVAVGETMATGNKNLDGLFLVLNADNGTVQLRKQIGGNADDSFNSVVQNFDGTFTLVGYTKSDANGAKDGWVVQLDLEGNPIYNEKVFSEWKGEDEIKDVAVNSEGTVLAAGWQNAQKTGDVWVLRIENKQIKDRIIGRGELGKVEGLTAGPDGSFVLVGTTGKENRRNPKDAWVLKIDKNGEDLWGGARYFGDSGFQEGLGITGTVDGGHAIVGVTNSRGSGSVDKWLIKIDKDGEKEWERAYGGPAADVATSVIELSEGGYAIFGQTWSHLPRARHSSLDLIITDEIGNELDSDTYLIVGGGGDEAAHSLIELFTGDIVIAGSSVPDKSNELPKLFVSAISYKEVDTWSKSRGDKNLYSSNISTAVSLSSASFFDANSNKFLESGERGYIALELFNNSNITLHNVSGRVSANSSSTALEFWENIKLGTLRAGQKKKLIVPVLAKESLPKGAYDLNINVEANGTHLASSTATVESNRPDPPKLMVGGRFIPATNPRPGESIVLNLDLINTGGLPSDPVEAYFRIPPGVRSIDSEKLSIPSLRPHEKRSLAFTFTYDATYRGKAIDIQFETKGRGLLAVLKTFQLELGDLQPIARGLPVEMLWVSPDPYETGTRNFYVNNNELTIKLKVSSENPLDKRNFNVLLNGRKEQGQKMDEAKLTKPVNEMGRHIQNYTNKIRLKEGPNKIRIQYEYGNGGSFKSRELVFNYTPHDKPSLHVISIGVPYHNLKYTSKDALDFARLYEALRNENGKGFKSVDVNPFTTQEETTTNIIREVFERLSYKRNGIKKEDLLVIYLSAHGKVNRYGEFLLMPSDYKPEAENTYSINFENDILKPLRFVDCKKLVFVDACHSGNAIAGSKNWTNEEAASKVMNDLIKTAPGLEIIASCGDNEFSYEDDVWENSAFTKAIKEAFGNKTVEVDGKMISADIFSGDGETIKSGGDGKISLKELKLFIQKRVPDLVHSTKKNPPTSQNPSNKTTDLLPEDMGIYYLENKKL